MRSIGAPLRASIVDGRPTCRDWRAGRCRRAISSASVFERVEATAATTRTIAGYPRGRADRRLESRAQLAEVARVEQRELRAPLRSQAAPAMRCTSESARRRGTAGAVYGRGACASTESRARCASCREGTSRGEVRRRRSSGDSSRRASRPRRHVRAISFAKSSGAGAPAESRAVKPMLSLAASAQRLTTRPSLRRR